MKQVVKKSGNLRQITRHLLGEEKRISNIQHGITNLPAGRQVSK